MLAKTSFALNYIAALASFGAGIFMFYSIGQLHDLTLHQDRLQIKPLWGAGEREILYGDIKSYTEIERREARNWKGIRTGSNIWKELTLYTEAGAYEISSDAYEDYEKIKQRITKGIPYNTEIDESVANDAGIGRILIPLIAAVGFICYLYINTEADTGLIFVVMLLIAMGLYRLMVSNKP